MHKSILSISSFKLFLFFAIRSPHSMYWMRAQWEQKFVNGSDNKVQFIPSCSRFRPVEDKGSPPLHAFFFFKFSKDFSFYFTNCEILLAYGSSTPFDFSLAICFPIFLQFYPLMATWKNMVKLISLPSIVSTGIDSFHLSFFSLGKIL